MEDSYRGERESKRHKEQIKRRVLDPATRMRRANKALEDLYMDNYHDDPHGDLVANKKLPKFQDSLKVSKKSKKSKDMEYYRCKYRRSFVQMVEYEQVVRPDQIHYPDAAAPPPNYPSRKFCSACGFPSTYTCITCGARYCSIPCQKLHVDTRCLKFTA